MASCVITNESRIALTVVESQYNEPRQLQLQLLLDMRDAGRLGTVLGEINNHLSNDPTVNKGLPFGASVAGLTAEHIRLHVVRVDGYHLSMCVHGFSFVMSDGKTRRTFWHSTCSLT